MRHSMIWKSVFREIRGSLGRFLAILAIIALGVGFFAGLKIIKADFLKSMTNYFQETNFYDYRILGELGFSKEQVDYFAQLSQVRAAEGALSFDMLYEDANGAGKVGRFHSVTQEINKVILTAGRMPQAEGECLADALYYGKNAIGQKLVFQEDNEQDQLDQFTGTQFTIVGIVKSPLYIQYERGNTSIGSGSVDAFFYLLPESFTADYYTEIYVKLERDFPLYSDAYKDYLDSLEDSFQESVEHACRMRFEDLPGLIADAEKTLSEKKEEAWEELEEARKQLEDGQAELADANEKLEDGKKQLEDGWAELEKAREDLKEAKRTIEEKEGELEKGIQEYEDGKKQLEENEALLLAKETELEQAKSVLGATEMTIQLGEMQQKLTMEGLISEQKTIDSAREQLDQRSKSADRLEETAAQLGLSDLYAEYLAKEREAIRTESAKLEEQLADLHGRYLDALATGEQIAAGKREWEAGQKQVQDGEKALLEGKDAIYQGKLDLLDAQRKIEDGKAALRDAKEQVKQGERDLLDGEKTLSEKEKELADGVLAYEDGMEEWREGMEEYEDGLKEFEEEIARAEKKIADQKETLQKGEAPEGYLLGRNTNIGYVCFENDSAIVDGIANVFPVFFFLVAALVCVTTMNRMVEDQRVQIGVLKALGYSDALIMFKYLFYSGLAALIGCVSGFVIGTMLFPTIIWTAYGIMYKAGPIAFTVSPGLVLFSLSVSLLCSVGTTYLTCGKELAAQAAQLMRPRAPKAGKRVFLEYVPFIWRHLSFLRKVAVRNIMRYKKRLFMMVLGIGGCTGLLLTGFGVQDSIADVGDMQFSEIQLYDISLLLQDGVDQAFCRELEGLREKGLGDYLPYRESTQDLVGDETLKSVTVIMLPEGITGERLAPFVDLHTGRGEAISPPGPGEAVITEKLASDFQVGVGDEILLRDGDMKEMHLKISGVTQNFIYNFVYLEQSTWERERGEEAVMKSVFLNLEEGCELRALVTAAMKLPGVANVTVSQDVLSRFNNMMSSLNLIVLVIIICAAGLAFIVLYNLTNINITERIREIATIKVLGFFAGETALYVFRENMVLTVLGAAAGLVMGKWLHAFVMSEINVDLVSFDVRILPASYVYSVLFTILFSLGVNILMSRKLEEINMTESLKSVD